MSGRRTGPRMRDIGRGIVVAALALSGLGAAPAGAQSRHSGTVTALDADRGTLTVGEVGPWVRRDGETVTIRRTFSLTAETRIVRVERRAEVAPGGWPGDFVEVPISLADLAPGVFVTVETDAAGTRPAARKISAVAPGGS